MSYSGLTKEARTVKRHAEGTASVGESPLKNAVTSFCRTPISFATDHALRPRDPAPRSTRAAPKLRPYPAVCMGRIKKQQDPGAPTHLRRHPKSHRPRSSQAKSRLPNTDPRPIGGPESTASHELRAMSAGGMGGERGARRPADQRGRGEQEERCRVLGHDDRVTV